MKKKTILLVVISLATSLFYISDNSVVFGLCDKPDLGCREFFNYAENAFYFSVVVLFFSLLTYKMRDQVFASWWKFARIGVPVTLLIVTLVNLELHHNPAGEMQGVLDVPFLFLVNTIFIIGSFIQIYRGYRK